MTKPMDTPERARTAAGIRLLLVLSVGWTAVIQREARGQAASKEYQVKAACLLNFAQFITWPAEAFSDSATPITVGVLGDDPFGTVLEQTLKDETAHDRKFVVKRSRQVDDLKNCHLLFVSKSEKERVPDILATVGESSVVTIGETDDFGKRGGVINFYLESNKVRFEINVGSAERKKLKISSQLLKRAKVIGSEGN